MTPILAIDPGPESSAYLTWNGSKVLDHAFLPNNDLRLLLFSGAFDGLTWAIEMVACYGMPVGRETFETCLWIGRYVERAEGADAKAILIYRKDVKLHLCGSARAKDGNIRQALLDKHGPCGTKKSPGPLYGVSGHAWAALAVADYALTLSAS